MKEVITAPPSQGKVERAREISHNIVSYCRECSFNLDVLKYTREEAEEYVISAITQALTEFSGQGTDGACCEAMREKAAKAVVSRLSHAAIEWQENNAIRAETYRWAASHAEKAIRALPLPVSADGDAVIEPTDEMVTAAADFCSRCDSDECGWLGCSRNQLRAALNLKSKQPDTGETT